MKAGAEVQVHLSCCHSPEQHERVILTGRVVHVYPDGATLARMADGSQRELPPWGLPECPNAVAAKSEAA